jgi:hypothetical protein
MDDVSWPEGWLELYRSSDLLPLLAIGASPLRDFGACLG